MLTKKISILVTNGAISPIDPKDIPFACTRCDSDWRVSINRDGGTRYDCDTCGCWMYQGEVSYSEKRRPTPVRDNIWKANRVEA